MEPRLKILTPDQLQMWSSLGDKVVMTNGCFDILHYGHIRHLVQAKTSGHRLLVAVDSDTRVRQLKGVTRPINPSERRLYALAALECVDGVVAFDDLPPLIRRVCPTTYTKSGYLFEELTPEERAAITDIKANFRDIPLESNISTTKILAQQ